MDLIAGAISESPKFGSAVGPVFQCIIKEQMSRTRMGDKYFYDNGGKFSSFKEGAVTQNPSVTRLPRKRVKCKKKLHELNYFYRSVERNQENYIGQNILRQRERNQEDASGPVQRSFVEKSTR